MGEIVGSLISGRAAKKAAQTQSAAQLEAARIGADAQRFKPVGITTAFGSSNFGFGPDGDLNSAGYNLSPEMAAQRDMFLSQAQNQGMGLANQAGQAGQGLFNLGQGYLAQTPEQAGQQYIAAQQALLAPGQEQQLAGIRNNQFQRGTSGLAVGATDAGGMGASNPELQAYYNSLQNTNLNLAAQAQAEGRAQTTFGSGLLSGGLDLVSEGYNPYKTQFGLGQSLEEAGQGAFNMSSALGGRQAQAGANVGQTLQSGGNLAANSMYAANSYSPLGAAISGLGSNKDFNSAISGMFSGFSTPTPSASASPFGLKGPSQGFATKSIYEF
tara:strand:- start:1242 stop:2222 length:981 start_codon:yes stop_codon:yes gene_type:complete